MASKLKNDDPPLVLLLHKAPGKWKASFSNCYERSEDYVFLLSSVPRKKQAGNSRGNAQTAVGVKALILLIKLKLLQLIVWLN